MRLFDFHNVSVRFAGTTVLDDVSIGLEAGEIVTIVGPNGSGKSLPPLR